MGIWDGPEHKYRSHSNSHMRKREFRGRISKSRAWGNFVQFVHNLAPLKLEVGSGHFKPHRDQPQPRLQPPSAQPSSNFTSTSMSTMASVGQLPTGNLTGTGKYSSQSFSILGFREISLIE